ncbi:MAG: bifunctional nuclease family protein [Chloroflexi bacterium]|nr:bifunctional nuclease family protein [Chloroflexota bacterium]MCL5074472.1 bifunctional nuclease family protein [Chloroflexota bacterium]
MVEMTVESVRVSLQTYQRVVVLKEKAAERYLPIWIGNNEADAIVLRLQNVPVPRPQTHDLLKSVILQLGAKVTRIVVNDLADDVFYARILMDLDGRHIEVDSRPSDAIALAVRVQAPIFVEESVLEKAAVTLGTERKETLHEETGQGVTEEELKRLSAFRNFINTLDLDDLGKPDSGSKGMQ